MSVPRPWPARRPIWQLVLGLIGLLAAVAWTIGLFTHADGNGFRLLMAVLWGGLGLTWIVRWRQAVKQYSARDTTPETSEPTVE